VSYRVDWHAGPNPQIELLRATGTFSFKYTPPFRPTLRPPIEPMNVGQADLRLASDELIKLAESLLPQGRDGAGVAGQPGVAPLTQIPELQLLGGLLYDLVITNAVRADLRPPNYLVDFGVDESLLHFPWELMHDGDEFICIKHGFGRFITDAAISPGGANPRTWLGTELEQISVLLINASRPLPRNVGTATEFHHPYLKAADEEAATVTRFLAGISGVSLEVVPSHDATYARVAHLLRSKRYQIVHFCGHATYSQTDPNTSCLVLRDRDMPAATAGKLLSRAEPILCVMNACDSVRVPNEKVFSVYSLARSLLDTGSYLVGSRWKLGDVAAAKFAEAFYRSLLGSEPLGHAVREGRRAAQAHAADPFSWASYVLYGDPRLCFRSISQPAPPP
jgi:hypothetical protein